MPKQLLNVWIKGTAVGVVLLGAGLLFNFRIQPAPLPACEGSEFVEYVSCYRDEPHRYYFTGWPIKMYCYNSGKHECSAWEDYLDIDRSMSRVDRWKQNVAWIVLGSFSLSLLFTSVLLSREITHSNKK